MSHAVARGTQARLPRLIDQRGLVEELGVTRAAAERIMRQIPKVHVPGLRKVYVKRDDVARMIEEDGLRDGMRSAGLTRAATFTWERAARELLALIEDRIA